MGDIKGPAPEDGISMARAAQMTAELGIDPTQVATIEDMLSDGRLVLERDPWDAGGTMRLYAPVPASNASIAIPERITFGGEEGAIPVDIGAPIAPQLGQIVVEVDLGPDDVLLLTCDQVLRYEAALRWEAKLRAVLDKPGRQALVIDAGMVPMVLHRTIPAEDKARKAKPYLEDMARPSASERVVDADIQDAVRTTSAADVSRGTSEDGKA